MWYFYLIYILNLLSLFLFTIYYRIFLHLSSVLIKEFLDKRIENFCVFISIHNVTARLVAT